MAKFPYPVKVEGLVDHSDNAGPDSRVCPCRSCGALHELVRVQVEAKLP